MIEFRYSSQERWTNCERDSFKGSKFEQHSCTRTWSVSCTDSSEKTTYSDHFQNQVYFDFLILSVGGKLQKLQSEESQKEIDYLREVFPEQMLRMRLAHQWWSFQPTPITCIEGITNTCLIPWVEIWHKKWDQRLGKNWEISKRTYPINIRTMYSNKMQLLISGKSLLRSSIPQLPKGKRLYIYVIGNKDLNIHQVCVTQLFMNDAKWHSQYQSLICVSEYRWSSQTACTCTLLNNLRERLCSTTHQEWCRKPCIYGATAYPKYN